MERQRHEETERETDAWRDRQRQIGRQRHGETETWKHRDREGDGDRLMERKRQRHGDTKTWRYKDRDTERQTQTQMHRYSRVSRLWLPVILQEVNNQQRLL
jgi:hypothetical protein